MSVDRDKHLDFQNIWRNAIVVIIVGAGTLMALVSIFYFMHDATIVDLGYKHFASIFGLPAAAAASLLVVLVTRAVSGAMSVEFFGLKFHGAASTTLAYFAIDWLNWIPESDFQ
jgi:hypothetical protein